MEVPEQIGERIGRRKEARTALSELLGRNEQIRKQLVSSEKQAEKLRVLLGGAIADQRPEAASIRGTLANAHAECEGLESALVEMGRRIKAARDAVQQADRAAGQAEINWHVAEAEKLKAETLAAAAVLAQSHARWHAHALRAASVASLIGVGGEPIPRQGVAAHLSRAADDGAGIFGVLRKYGLSERFAVFDRELLPKVSAFADHVPTVDEGEDDVDEEGVIITAGPASDHEPDEEEGDDEDGDPDAVVNDKC